MKKLFAFLSFGLCSMAMIQAQQTITITTDSANTWDTEIASGVNSAGNNYGNWTKHYVYTWTQSGEPVVIRSLIRIDMSSLPAQAQVNKAVLTLHYDPTCSPGLAGQNSFRIERITSAWNENTVTWNTQPSTDVSVAAQTPNYAPGDSLFEIDVTNVIDAIVKNGTNYGMMMSLGTEIPYANFGFASSDHPDAALRPSLKVTYFHAGISRPANTISVSAYPNPSSDELFIKTEANNSSVFTVYDALGKQVHNGSLNAGTTRLDVRDFSSGVYRVVVSNTAGNNTFSFVKN